VVENALCLCSLHHKLLDFGVLGLTDHHRLLVSMYFVARSEAGQRRVLDLAGRSLLEPQRGSAKGAEQPHQLAYQSGVQGARPRSLSEANSDAGRGSWGWPCRPTQAGGRSTFLATRVLVRLLIGDASFRAVTSIGRATISPSQELAVDHVALASTWPRSRVGEVDDQPLGFVVH
jgi:hypothetical protein